MTIKIYNDPKFPEEHEVHIQEDYDIGVKFLTSLGLEKKAAQESYREKWSHDLAHELTFDTLPGLPTYMEVDCTSEEDLNKMIDLLELDKSKMRFGAFDLTYEEYYGIDTETINNKTPSITFVGIMDEIKPTKNFELLEKIYKSYRLDKKIERTKKVKKSSKKSSKKKAKNLAKQKNINK